MGIDASGAVERARSRSVSRVGRKRERSQGPTDMEIDGQEDAAAPEKRIHSGRSRWNSRLRDAGIESLLIVKMVCLPCPQFLMSPELAGQTRAHI